MKPIELIANALLDGTKAGDAVLDVFGGSGSTLIACEQLKRKCFMTELSEHYVSVIVDRYINAVGGSDNVFCIRNGEKKAYSDIK